MNNISRNKTGIVILCLSIGLIMIWHLRGYVFVIDYPQNALLTKEPLITVSSIKIDGKDGDFIPAWNIKVDKPHRYLSSVGEISFGISGVDSKIFVGISLCPKIKTMSRSELDIDNSQLVLGIYVRKNDKTYMSEWSEASAHCGGLIQGEIRSNLQPTGMLRIENFTQSIKHLSAAGQIDLTATLIGSNKEDTLNLEITGLKFQIDSPVIYEWSNKAGRTWRL